ncbi:MAG: Spy/CpxP family protein refolding chaperone [gamma proteobacterium symbiont of Clathrolucina costata]|uniref:Spy/CpxP family protein refolding chaperone n=1 Tax=Candidatus Thiodiazotropha taylori TaxID=2792791 RepID=A0A9E4NHG9_9GAMM|nr:Spy/CpxP family protein refolding chaperone [Candidatus Thiodiazotropha taylori]MCW4235466.1 Spy/CpxP family protein refolding chaperone [Candidatus Thiodiazotropha endolucinida]
MKQSTKHIVTLVGAAALIVGAGSIAFAHGYGPGYGQGWGGHHGMMGGPVGSRGMGMMMGGYTAGNADQQLTNLRSSLGITTDQETAWNRYADAVEGRAGLMQSHRQQMFSSGPVSPDQRQNFHQQGLEQMQQVSAARQELFNVLTPKQRAMADTYTGWPCAVR